MSKRGTHGRSAAKRDARTLTVPCPFCGAAAGQPCRNPKPHQDWRGPEDRRDQPKRPHAERRVAAQAARRKNEMPIRTIPGCYAALAALRQEAAQRGDSFLLLSDRSDYLYLSDRADGNDVAAHLATEPRLCLRLIEESGRAGYVLPGAGQNHQPPSARSTGIPGRPILMSSPPFDHRRRHPT